MTRDSLARWLRFKPRWFVRGAVVTLSPFVLIANVGVGAAMGARHWWRETRRVLGALRK